MGLPAGSERCRPRAMDLVSELGTKAVSDLTCPVRFGFEVGTMGNAQSLCPKACVSLPTHEQGIVDFALSSSPFPTGIYRAVSDLSVLFNLARQGAALSRSHPLRLASTPSLPVLCKEHFTLAVGPGQRAGIPCLLRSPRHRAGLRRFPTGSACRGSFSSTSRSVPGVQQTGADRACRGPACKCHLESVRESL